MFVLPPDRNAPVAPAATLALLVTLVATAPLWFTSWLRDDWLMLWHALEPATSPPLATGHFPRPVADLAWKAAVAISGDQPWGMHGLVWLAWVAIVWGSLVWARAWGSRGVLAAIVLATWLGAHGALVELRQWAAASNGVFAFAFAIWGAWLARAPIGFPRLALGFVLVVVGMLARADAVLVLALPAAEATLRAGRRAWLGLALFTVAGVAALAWMLASAGQWSFLPEKGLRLAALALWPWGLQRLPALALAVGLMVAVGILVGWGRRSRELRAAALASLLGLLAMLAAGTLSSWSAAGRYTLGATIPLALFASLLVARRAELPRGRWVAALVLAGGGLHVASALVGGTSRELRRTSGHEMALYRWAQQREEPLPSVLRVEDPPSLGWSSSAGDLENVLSCAARRRIEVRDDARESTVRWTGEGWREVTRPRLP